MQSTLIAPVKQCMQHSATPFGLWDTDKHTLLYSNPALDHFINQHQMASGKFLLSDHAELTEAMRECLRTADAVAKELPQLQARLEFIPVGLQYGEAALVQCMITPLTASAQSTPEAAAQPLQNAAYEILNNLPHNAFLVSPKGEIFWTNKTANLYSYNQPDFVDLSSTRWTAKIHPEDLQLAHEKLSQGLLQGQLEPFHLRLKNHAGQFHWYLCTAVPLHDAEGKLLYWVGINTNVDRYKLKEEELENRLAQLAAKGDLDKGKLQHAQDLVAQSQKMELVSNLAGGVAHDLNNLLFVMGLNADLLRKQLPTEAMKEKADILRSCIKKSGRLCAQLVSFSGRKPHYVESINPHDVMTELGDLLQKSMGAEVRFALRVAEDVNSISVDKMYFENALLNLAINARDAVNGRGNVSFDISNQQVHHDGELRDYVVCNVIDNGMGMPPEVRLKVFEPFFTTKAPGKGTGLGLPMVKLFMDNTNGFIEIDSTPGKGTTVSLYFPRTEPLGDEVIEPELEDAKGSESVLIIEDDIEVRAAIATSLNELGYHVITSFNLEQALRFFQSGLRVDLIVSDVKMPGNVTAAGFIAQMRAQALDIPIIFTTGYSPEVLAQEGVDECQFPVLFKPFSTHELSQMLRTTLSNATSSDQGSHSSEAQMQ